jgi:hypothetical protein
VLRRRSRRHLNVAEVPGFEIFVGIWVIEKRF